MLFSLAFRLKWSVVLCLVAVSAGCKSIAPEEPKPTFNCQSAESSALAFSHLKEAYISMDVLTVEAAKRSIALSTDGLSCAPPRGKASAATVARLLMERARAYSSLDENEAALADLNAALMWAEQGKKEDPLIVPELHLESARLFLRQQAHDKAANSAARARDSADRLGEQAAGLQCEALLLEGDLANRRAKSDFPPDGYFRRVFEVAQRYQYPESVWDPMERAAFRLKDLDESNREELLGPVRALQERKLKDEEERRLLSVREATKSLDLVTLSSGSIAGAEQTVAAMRAGFRECFRRAIDSSEGGRAELSISVGASGAVEHVDAKSEKMSPAVLDCLTAEARAAQFNPPATGHAVLSVPVTFIQQ